MGNPGAFTYTLDALGNMTTFGPYQTRTVNARNQITQVSGIGATTPVYDNAGELTSGLATNGSSNLTLVYDAWGQVFKIYPTGNPSSPWEAFQYDALGERITTVNYVTNHGPSTVFSPSGQILQESDSSGNYVTYVWGITYVNDLVSEDQTSGSNLLTSQHIYAEHDANYDVTTTINDDASPRSAVDYDPYGNESTVENWGTSSDFNIGYQGWQVRRPRRRLICSTTGFTFRDWGFGIGGPGWQRC